MTPPRGQDTYCDSHMRVSVEDHHVDTICQRPLQDMIYTLLWASEETSQCLP